jgi:hypothetical protein
MKKLTGFHHDNGEFYEASGIVKYENKKIIHEKKF